MRNDHQLYWGDFHCHLEDIDHASRYLEEARRNTDFYPVLCYPFKWYVCRGLKVESVRQRPEFIGWWQKLREVVRRFHQPGRFVTFLGYEWHGNRRQYGDHNVFYFDDSGPLDDAWTLNSLYKNLKKTRAIAIPHHTGYLPGRRGKDWGFHDDNLSPVTEIFSDHGSSEGTDTPLPLRNNGSMGPRVTGGTWQDGLAQGHRLGCIASGDGPGLAGRWGKGLAGLWAKDLTRESLWEALLERRTYAVTGDRIRLRFSANGHPMGSVIRRADTLEFTADVEGLHAMDRIELIRNGRVMDTYCHSGKWIHPAGASRVKIRIESGWGPATYYGFPKGKSIWDMRLQVCGGRLLASTPCFSLLGQRMEKIEKDGCAWRFDIPYRTDSGSWKEFCQSVVFEVQGTPETILQIWANGRRFSVKLKETLVGSHLFPLLAESRKIIFKTFNLSASEIANPDIYYQNAGKVKVHLAVPETGYKISVRFRDTAVPRGHNYYYLRVTQTNGQMAWSSPIWVR